VTCRGVDRHCLETGGLTMADSTTSAVQRSPVKRWKDWAERHRARHRSRPPWAWLVATVGEGDIGICK
jgi:hypothetical protein